MVSALSLQSVFGLNESPCSFIADLNPRIPSPTPLPNPGSLFGLNTDVENEQQVQGVGPTFKHGNSFVSDVLTCLTGRRSLDYWLAGLSQGSSLGLHG